MTQVVDGTARRSKAQGGLGGKRSKQPAANGPIYVIVAFLGVTDAGLAYASSQADGYVQMAVLVFLALYTLYVATMFFVILWNRNWVLYPSSEYGYPKPQDFVSAMRGDQVRAGRLATDVRQEMANDGTLGQRFSDATNGLPPEKQQAILGLVEQMRTAVVQKIEDAVIFVDASPLKGRGASKWEIAYDARMPVLRVIDRVLWRLQPFPPYPYGTMWVLRDKESGVVFSDVGPTWAERRGKSEDNRTVFDVGIVGGMVLEVINPSVTKVEGVVA